MKIEYIALILVELALWAPDSIGVPAAITCTIVFPLYVLWFIGKQKKVKREARNMPVQTYHWNELDRRS